MSGDNESLLSCPFCGPGQSMVDTWHDDVSKRWAVGCGRCGASSGRSVHAEGSKESAIKSWNTRPPTAVSDPFMEDYKRDTLRDIRDAIIEECKTVIKNLRTRAATDFKDPKCAGQRGQDRCDALYDAYQAVKALSLSSHPSKSEAQ